MCDKNKLDKDFKFYHNLGYLEAEDLNEQNTCKYKQV